MLESVFRPFVQERPVCVMARGVLERLWSPERLDELFERVAQVQYTREVLFSNLVDLMGQVVLNLQPSVHAAYQARQETLDASAKAVYDKLAGIEPQVSAALVAESARQAAPVIDALQGREPSWLPGYHIKIVDGNHFSATQHRLKELRTTWAAPLPGKALVVLDQQSGLVEHVVPEEDGQAQERSRLGDVLERVSPGELWIADRNFCTIGFLCSIAECGAHFLIRQHGQLQGTPLGAPKAKGRCASGAVFEQKLRLAEYDNGEVFIVRRITVQLDQPTRDGDTEIHLLTNVPPRRGTAVRLADLYRQRWTIETVFQRIAETLTCEVETLAYPKAALFAFCLALTAYNAVVVLRTALAAAHGRQTVDTNVSGYYLALEISQTYDGMMIALPPQRWQRFRTLSPSALAQLLTEIAAHTRLSRYQKHPRGPKKKPAKRKPYQNGSHVSTAKLLAERKRET